MTGSKFAQVAFLVVVGLLIRRDTLWADEDQPAVEVLNPKPDSEVEETEFIEGRLAKVDGKHPVVLVKALQPAGQPWWIAEPVKSIDKDGVFEAQATFGRAQDASIKYAVMIFLAKDKVEADSYKAGKQLQKLPEAPQSKIVKVKRK